MKLNKSLLCVLIMASAQSFAGMLATEDAGVLDQGQCELEGVYSHSKAKDGTAAQEWTVQPTCGLGFNSQLGAGYGRDWQDGVANRSQWLAGKTSLKALSETDWGLALAYSATRAQAQGDVYRLSETVVNAAFTLPLADNFVHANLGWQKPRNGDVQAMSWALAYEHNGLAGPIDAGLELLGDNHTAPTMQVGLRWNVIADRLTVNASLGQQINPERTRTVSTGIKVSF